MTDAQLAPACNTYTAWRGAERHAGDRRRHLRTNMTATCSASDDLQRGRRHDISIWVIAFGTTLSQDMTDCASNANQASTAADRDTP